MIPKPLAVCSNVGMDTCVVVDSGALSTSVAVVVNGQLVPGRWKLIPVGGWHVSEYLKEAMQWQPEECAEVGHGL
jgi:actin-related protein